MTEDEWVSRLLDLALLCRWRVTHFRAAWTARGWRTPVQGHIGFPDLVCVRPPRIEFIEAKVKSRLRAEQALWLELLNACVPDNPLVGVRLWTPDDWPTALRILK